MTTYVQIENDAITNTWGGKPNKFQIPDIGQWITGTDKWTDEKLLTYSIYPVIKETLGDYQEHGDFVVGETTVTYPATAMADEDIISKNKVNAKTTRDQATEANITVLSAEWQVNSTSRDNMARYIDCYESTDTVTWTLADNAERETTMAELQQVLNAYTERLAAIYAQYQAWRSGDMLQAFEYVAPGAE